MEITKHLIIGAGPAALAAAQAIRETDISAEITLVTKENSIPYSPAMLPYLISKELDENDFFAKGKDLLDNLNIKLLFGKEVVAVWPEKNEVEYADGVREAYDKLLIAAGASPQITLKDQLPEEQIFTFRTFQDFERLNKILGTQQEIAIFGAGLVAVEAAEKLCLAGHKVTVIARSSLLRKYFDPQNVAALTQAFNKCGAKIITKNTLVAAKKMDNKLELTLENGDTLLVDRLIAATGVAANLIKHDSLALAEGGLKVGKYMETELPNIYAAGDVAAAPCFFGGQNAPCPILPEAVLQGKIAGANMAGETVEYEGWVPCNYLRCFDEHLFSIGVTSTAEGQPYQVVEKRDGGSSLKLVFDEDCLIGAEGLNMKYTHPGVFLYLIKEQIPVKKYKDLLMDKPKETACWLMSQHRKNQAI